MNSSGLKETRRLDKIVWFQELIAQDHLKGTIVKRSSSQARYFTELAEEAEPYMNGPQQVTWVKRLEAEHDNLRAALAWSIDNDSELSLRLAGALGRFWKKASPYFDN